MRLNLEMEWVLPVLFSILNLAAAQISSDLVVETIKGKIQGFESISPQGRKVSAWYGIPFAQPPVGNLRFRHPRPIDPWEGVLNTMKLPNTCVQIRDSMFPGFPGSEQWNANTPLSEDCLYLNVVVPNPHPENAAVIIWVYGGGFYSGTATLDLYDMRTFASEENVIMVSIQYRVASLAFLFFDTEDVPGNAGMFDQLMALQWVKDNIKRFGGNPNNITLMGESAGACSVALHLLSPLSRNLFSQAIMQSASATNPWGVITKEESFIRGLRLAELMNCPHDKANIRQTIDCLRTANATDMVYKEWGGITLGLTIGIFTPIIDGSFLDEKPAVSMKNGNFKKCNILTGTNQDEGMFFIFYHLPDMFKKEEDVFISREDFKRAITELNIYANPQQKKAIEFEYTNWMNPQDPIKNRMEVDRFTGDWQFTCPVIEFAHRYAETGNNVYMYYFTQKSSVSKWPAWSGALHADEIHFLFGQPLNKTYGYKDSEVKLSKKMMTYWANFAKTGNPSLSADNRWTDDYWPMHTPLKRETLLLNADKTEIMEGNRVKKCAFWRKFLPQLANTAPPPAPGCDESCCSSAAAVASAASSLFYFSEAALTIQLLLRF
ncbi:acetylcholinesterase [Eurytemora carolleeae]|uniref:acetylcholinesterase n=1 Tax=Eurytemora carolleeae TaxID=1294199 RepID=UPI000C77F44B|nr:acetylcholinesterase [Eurytemora carolleeae]XP_023322615.1 acetylcholinesterase [Eurytemora carolleeae]|eukprot:XP_023322609.1 acetylcholinesterase-like [Eurytemora affinis]